MGALLRRVLVLCLLAASLLMPAGAAMAGKFALVIGNAAYATFGTLANTQRDADSFAGFLSASGFSVSAVSDASSATLSAAVQGFAAGLRAGDVAVFYFAGHSMLSGGRDYLVGVDAQLLSEGDVPFIFCTGLDRGDIVERHRDRPLLAKPFLEQHLQEWLARLSPRAAVPAE